MRDGCGVTLEVKLARLDERIKGLCESLERSERDRDRAIKLAADELSRRLDILNHAHEAAVEVQARQVPRETFEIYADGIREELARREIRISALEGNYREMQGKMWLPMTVVAGAAAAITAVLLKILP